MAIRIKFDASGNPEQPTLILSNRSGNKIGQLPARSIHMKGCQNNPSEITFELYKYVDGKKDPIWDEVRNFKLVWCKEWDRWFQMIVDINEDEYQNLKKTVSCIQLGQAELSQIMLYNIEINTEDDIARDDYIIPTTLYDPEHPEASLLNRILEKAPHYSVTHVDSSIANIQRTFSFDGTSIYDAFQDISEEIGCLFVFPSDSNESGKINRTIDVYDLESDCLDCGYRGEFSDVCPECGSKNITEGYGKDTTIFVTSDELAEGDIQFTTNTDSVKNCFKLEAGDNLMTATIRNCNPNGSDYIWYITDESKEDMSDELVEKLNSYNQRYTHYQNDFVANIDPDVIEQYNQLVTKYKEYDPDLEYIIPQIVGYSALMTAYYNTIDLAVYLQSALMPNVSISDTSAVLQADLLTPGNLSPIAVTNLKSLSLATANNAVLGMAKAIVDARYQVKVRESRLSDNIWTGSFIVTNYSDAGDTAESSTISIYITDDYAEYVKQKLDKALAKENVDNLSISALFQKDYSSFCKELKKYSLHYLNNFASACQSCIDILIEQGVADAETWYHSGSGNLYDDLYIPYYEKLSATHAEIQIRENEINSILGTYDSDEVLVTPGMQNFIIDIKNDIQENLDFQKYLGEKLWSEFCAYRREDKYTNSNYVSDGLDNAEFFENALEFLQTASNEIYKSAELQHSISTTLKNLLVIDKFKPIVQHFEVGNWIRVRIDDKVYKLRLIEYEIDYDNLASVSVGFSDVLKVSDGISDMQDILSRAQSMATSYDSVQRQASQGFKGSNTINDWVENGLDATNTMIIGGAGNQVQTWDEHGILLREYDSIIDDYLPTQMRFINSTIAITNDNWETVKTAIGKYYYFDPVTNEMKEAYGVNGETIIGKLLLGENLGIYSDNGSLTFDRNGLTITNGVNTFTVNPNSSTLLSYSVGSKQLLYATQDDLVFAGRLFAESGTIGGWTLSGGKLYGGTSSSGVAVMQVPVNNNTWVFAAGGKSHTDYSGCPFRVNAAGELYAKTGVFGNVVSNANGTSGNFNNGFSASSSFGVTGGALNDFNNLVVKNITAENIMATNVLANYVTANVLNAATARIAILETDRITASEVEAINLTLTGKINGIDAKFKNIDATNITTGTLSAKRIDINEIASAFSAVRLYTIAVNTSELYLSSIFQYGGIGVTWQHKSFVDGEGNQVNFTYLGAT